VNGPRVGSHVRIKSTSETGTLQMKARYSDGSILCVVIFDCPDALGLTGANVWLWDIEAISKPRSRKIAARRKP
jgi:hypothetical protein